MKAESKREEKQYQENLETRFCFQLISFPENIVAQPWAGWLCYKEACSLSLAPRNKAKWKSSSQLHAIWFVGKSSTILSTIVSDCCHKLLFFSTASLCFLFQPNWTVSVRKKEGSHFFSSYFFSPAYFVHPLSWHSARTHCCQLMSLSEYIHLECSTWKK